jgi:hypothetical protein
MPEDWTPEHAIAALVVLARKIKAVPLDVILWLQDMPREIVMQILDSSELRAIPLPDGPGPDNAVIGTLQHLALMPRAKVNELLDDRPSTTDLAKGGSING